MLKLIAWLFGVVILGGAAFYVFSQPTSAPEPDLATTTPESNISAVQYKWQYADIGENATTSAPQTNVTLYDGVTPHDLGVFSGSCSDVDPANLHLNEGELSASLCWFAGGGNEIGVFQEGTSTVVKVGIVDEGTVQEGGFRGNFKTVLQLQ